MTPDDRARWDARYAHTARHSHDHPNPILMRYAPPALPGSRALELACGLGQDTLWLAEQGYCVDAFDVSLVALRRARATMLDRGITGASFVAADLDHFPLPRRTYDLVYVYRFLERRLFPALRDGVRPGGVAIYQTFNLTRRDWHPHANPDHMLRPGELLEHFAGWEIVAASDEGADATSFVVARRPEVR